MPRGGNRPNAGRPQLHSREQREEIAREFEARMQAVGAATVVAKARQIDPVRRKRWAIDAQMREKAIRFADQRVPKSLIAQLEAAGEPMPFPAIMKRAKGYRDRVAREVAQLFQCKPRTVIEYVNQQRKRKRLSAV
jgi:hypothetical protein